jgi:hypothetical protein
MTYGPIIYDVQPDLRPLDGEVPTLQVGRNIGQHPSSRRSGDLLKVSKESAIIAINDTIIRHSNMAIHEQHSLLCAKLLRS